MRALVDDADRARRLAGRRRYRWRYEARRDYRSFCRLAALDGFDLA